MSLEGHIEDGRVVFDEPVSLPNGTAVRVEVVATNGAAASPSTYDAFFSLAGQNVIDIDAVKKLRDASVL
jgi:hypothetical protein